MLLYEVSVEKLYNACDVVSNAPLKNPLASLVPSYA